MIKRFLHSTDINECKETPEVCMNGACTNTKGGFECKCPDGYVYSRKEGKCIGKYIISIDFKFVLRFVWSLYVLYCRFTKNASWYIKVERFIYYKKASLKRRDSSPQQAYFVVSYSSGDTLMCCTCSLSLGHVIQIGINTHSDLHFKLIHLCCIYSWWSFSSC